MTWTRFIDMHSGGSQKLDWAYIYIEAPEEKAVEVLENKYGIVPYDTTCECCGQDYTINEEKDLKQATGFERNAPHTETPRDPKTGLFHNDDPNACLMLDVGEKPPKGYKIDDRLTSGDFIPLEEYIKQKDVLVIYKSEIGKED